MRPDPVLLTVMKSENELYVQILWDGWRMYTLAGEKSALDLISEMSDTYIDLTGDAQTPAAVKYYTGDSAFAEVLGQVLSKKYGYSYNIVKLSNDTMATQSLPLSARERELLSGRCSECGHLSALHRYAGCDDKCDVCDCSY